MSCSVFVTRLMMLLLYFNILIISQLLSKTTKSSYRLQGHEGRSVQFELSLVSANFYASCKLHRPVFMTLEPIWCLCSFTEKLRIDEYFEVQQQHRCGKESKWNKFGWNEQFMRIWMKCWSIPAVPTDPPEFLCSNSLKETFKNLS